MSCYTIVVPFQNGELSHEEMMKKFNLFKTTFDKMRSALSEEDGAEQYEKEEEDEAEQYEKEEDDGAEQYEKEEEDGAEQYEKEEDDETDKEPSGEDDLHDEL